MATELVTQPQKEAPQRMVYEFGEVLAMLGISRSAGHELLKKGQLPVTPFRVGGKWKFPKEAVDRLLGLEG